MFFHFSYRNYGTKINYVLCMIKITTLFVYHNYYYFSKFRTNIKIKIVFFICVVHNKYAIISRMCDNQPRTRG